MFFQLPSCKHLQKNGLFCSNNSSSISTENQKLIDLFFPEFPSRNIAMVNNMEKQNLDDSPHAKRKLHLCQHSKLCNVCKATRFPNDKERIRF